jgi:hypothetical protein
MVCGQCGSELSEDARFCGHCGTPREAILPGSSEDVPAVETASAVPTVLMDHQDATAAAPADEPADTDSEGQSDSELAVAPAVPTPEEKEPDTASRAPESDLPRMSLVANLGDRPGRHEALGITWESQRWVVASPGERVVSRWICTQAVCVAPTDDGPATLFKGAGIWTLTSRRLIGLLSTGESIEGRVADNAALFVTLSLAAISSISLLREASGRGFKEKGVTVETERCALMLDLDRNVNERRRPSKQNLTEGMRLIVQTTVELKGSAASPETRELLDRALRGEWQLDDDDLVATLGPPLAITTDTVPTGAPPSDDVREEASPPPAPRPAPAPAAPSQQLTGAPPPSGAPRTDVPPPISQTPRSAAGHFATKLTSAAPSQVPTPAPAPPWTRPATPRPRLSMDAEVTDARKLLSFATAGACLLLLIDLIVPWQHYGGGGFSVSRSGAHGLGVLLIVLSLSLGIGALLLGLQPRASVNRHPIGFALVGAAVVVLLGTIIHVTSTNGFDTAAQPIAVLLGLVVGACGASLGASLLFLVEEDETRSVRDAVATARRRRLERIVVPTSAPMAPPAGWYDDPQRAGMKRWWDGSNWGLTDAEYHEQIGSEQ